MNQPLDNLDDWDDFIGQVYDGPAKSKNEFRQYDDPAKDSIREFYRLNHRFQTVDFVQSKRDKFLKFKQKRLGIWEAFDFLETLVDDSDPDIELTQFQHLLQTSEAIRAEGLPDWFVLTGLVHDLGKVLCLFGEPQWAVVGDTFPVGCAFSDKIVFAEFFSDNPDFGHEVYSDHLGIYRANCGLRNVMMSWGHDEYLFHLFKDYLPEPALYMIRYHSFYAQHREEAYDQLMDDHDHEMFRWVREFNRFDLYSKSEDAPDFSKLQPYYESLVAKYLPERISL